MRVVIGPVIVGTSVCRIVSPVESLLEVEEWVGQWWEPSVVPLSVASVSPPAIVDDLMARGIPEADWVASHPSLDQSMIESLIRTSDPERSIEMRFDDPAVQRYEVTRLRVYPGNARFRKGTLSPTDSAWTKPERRRFADPNWSGPWRRASDRPTE